MEKCEKTPPWGGIGIAETCRLWGAFCLFLVLLLMLYRPCAMADGIYEAEDALLSDALRAEEDPEASQNRAVGRFSNQEDRLVFRIRIEQDGFYDLEFTGKGIGSDKINSVSADGLALGEIRHPEGSYAADVLRRTPLTAGEHEICVTARKGWFYLDCLRVLQAEPVPKSVYEVTAPLSNPNANAETQALYRFLQDCYGRYILSGQYSDEAFGGKELEAVHAVTGKYPAILGLDIRNYAVSNQYFGAKGNTVEHAIAFHKAGGIVSFCWHWNAPAMTIIPEANEEDDPSWWKGAHEQNSFFDLRRVMYGDDPNGKQALDMDIQAIAAQLKRLEEEHVPVLWRPLHEASGGWFWWGADGPDAFKQLWIYLYKTLTEVYHCNNLIWVCSCLDPAWYPGDAYVDIIGDDVYQKPRQYGPLADNFSDLMLYSPQGKILALTENGVVPDSALCRQAGVYWSWFCTWKDEYVTTDGEYASDYTEKELLQSVYDSEIVLTLDELERLRGY